MNLQNANQKSIYGNTAQVCDCSNACEKTSDCKSPRRQPQIILVLTINTHLVSAGFSLQNVVTLEINCRVQSPAINTKLSLTSPPSSSFNSSHLARRQTSDGTKQRRSNNIITVGRFLGRCRTLGRTFAGTERQNQHIQETQTSWSQLPLRITLLPCRSRRSGLFTGSCPRLCEYDSSRRSNMLRKGLAKSKLSAEASRRLGTAA